MQYRAEVDATVVLTGGGTLQARGLRVDVPHGEATTAETAEALVGALRLRDVERVDLASVRIFAEPTAISGQSPRRTRFVELSHVIEDGMTTYPGTPGPVITAHETWDRSSSRYADGTSFSTDRIEMVGQTGTYLDSPRHRYEGGTDLAGLPLQRLADLPAVVVRLAGTGRRVVEESDIEPLVVAGHAVLLHTGGDEHWGRPEYSHEHPYLSEAAASLLAVRGAALVGIDSVNIDDTSAAAQGARPAHTILLAAGIPIVEHLTGLAELPPTGATFTAAPPRIVAFGTFPVRAYASLPYFESHDHGRSAGWLPVTGS